ncbi:MAG: L-glutamate gamma-semialdehyde dehydrogenase [Planctomycetota bacterium]|nr:L-glutamate gamma-semialdehyde dehydrogenase [Planctomycetota bacterium]
MPNTVFRRTEPQNEPIRSYAPGTAETASLQARLAAMASETVEIPCIVGGQEILTGEVRSWTAPHDHSLELCRWHAATPEVVESALASSKEAWQTWSETDPHVRVAVFEKAAALLAGPWRDTLNASTMLGQSKTCFQAEIDAACELIDFWRFNAWFALHRIYPEQPGSPPEMWNHVDHRPLEGFVYAATPFNFTSIAANLSSAPALMGNTVIWKPSESSMLSNYYLMKLMEEAGLPPGVINFLPGEPAGITEQLLGSREFAGLHFTGSTAVFRYLWKQIAERLGDYRSYPRIVGETGGKDFIFAHESADLETLVVAALRGAFEFQGQKCSAASRMYVPNTIWPAFRDRLIAEMEQIRMGDPADWSQFMAAVIHEGAYDRITGYVERAKMGARVLAGGKPSKERGWFVDPTLIECEDPQYETMREELFGPVLSVHVYDANKLDDALALCDATSPYALTGAVFARDRTVSEHMARALRHAAGNFYINDKPTGAVVHQQPFGGARASGTDDKAGAPQNLMRWVAPRSVKETYVPPRTWRYPHMGA